MGETVGDGGEESGGGGVSEGGGFVEVVVEEAVALFGVEG